MFIPRHWEKVIFRQHPHRLGPVLLDLASHLQSVARIVGSAESKRLVRSHSVITVGMDEKTQVHPRARA